MAEMSISVSGSALHGLLQHACHAAVHMAWRERAYSVVDRRTGNVANGHRLIGCCREGAFIQHCWRETVGTDRQGRYLSQICLQQQIGCSQAFQCLLHCSTCSVSPDEGLHLQARCSHPPGISLSADQPQTSKQSAKQKTLPPVSMHSRMCKSANKWTRRNSTRV